MPVTSTPIASQRQSARGSDGCLATAIYALLLITIGPIVLIWNGGFSIVGMDWLAVHLGSYAQFAWILVTG